ncbi:MAG: hypothetical protein H5T74_13720 [Actinobacteria bacterium]|nr:hypothetical protein [Actinomycetota bacterium]
MAGPAGPGAYAGGTHSASSSSWERKAASGFGVPGNSEIHALASFRGRLYGGTYNPSGCQVWSWDGLSWTQEVGGGSSGTPTAPGFGDPRNNNVSSMAVFSSRLYLGVRNPDTGCRIWSWDGRSWTQEVGGGPPGTPTAPGFGDPGNTDVPSLAVFSGRLYAGTFNAGGCQVWSWDGREWKRVAEGGFGDAGNQGASAMAVYFGSLYAGTYNNDYTSGCQVWSFDGTRWTQEVGGGPSGTPTAPGFGDPDNRRAASMAVYNAGLYVGTYDSSGGSGCQVWSFDGANWTRVGGDGFGDRANLSAVSLAAGAVDLFAGTYNEESGCEVWRYDGSSWHLEGDGGFGDAGNISAQALLVEGGELTAAASNLQGAQVWRARVSHVLYFAEGYTGEGFREFLCLGNPGPRTARAALTYLFPDGSSLTRLLPVPPESRVTLFVNADVGTDREVSAVLESDRFLVGERPMYFSYGGGRAGGHDAAGVPSPSTVWYFAEGYTGSGFEEWICVLNPCDCEAGLTFRFQTQEEGEVVKDGFSVPPRSRRSFKANDILGSGYQASLKLSSDLPVVAERSVYFDYAGTAGHGWKGGHCVPGATRLAQLYYFAEGTTREGFEEWLTLQNPNPRIITVYASFRFGEGQGDPVERSYVVQPGKRLTVFVPGEVGREKDVSVVLVSTSFFLAERPMYFRYRGFGADWDGGDCVMGATAAGREWFFAEGYTGESFHTWLCIYNPGVDEALVLIRYFTEEEGPLEDRTLRLPAGTRQTLFVNEHAGEGYQLSARVVSDRPILAERPIYFDCGGGVSGGHVVAGFAP